jgi:hypothetical protein
VHDRSPPGARPAVAVTPRQGHARLWRVETTPGIFFLGQEGRQERRSLFIVGRRGETPAARYLCVYQGQSSVGNRVPGTSPPVLPCQETPHTQAQAAPGCTLTTTCHLPHCHMCTCCHCHMLRTCRRLLYVPAPVLLRAPRREQGLVSRARHNY